MRLGERNRRNEEWYRLNKVVGKSLYWIAQEYGYQWRTVRNAVRAVEKKRMQDEAREDGRAK